jgi:hypothetical protein
VKRIFVGILLVLCACQKPKPAPVVLHPAGSQAKTGDCVPTVGTPAVIVDESRETEVEPWWETHSAKCPKTTRFTYPSDREVDKAIGKTYGDEWMNWRERHVTCVPDGQ